MFELGVDESMDMHVDQLNEQGNQTIEVRERFADESLDNREEARQPIKCNGHSFVWATHLNDRSHAERSATEPSWCYIE